MKCLKFYGYFVLLFVLLFITCPNVKASGDTFSQQQIEYILNYYKNNEHNSYYASNYASGDFSLLNTIIQDINVLELKNALNQKIYNYETQNNISFNISNFSCYFVRGSYIDTTEKTAKERISLTFIINPNNNLKYQLNQKSSNFDIKDNTKTIYFIPILLSYRENNNTLITFLEQNGITTNSNSIPYIRPREEPSLNIEEQTINLPFYLGFNENAKIFYNNVEYTNTNFKIFNADGTIQTDITEGTETANQYEFFRDSNNNEVNLLFNGNEYIGCIFYIGDNLTSTYNFYYMNGEEKISVNNYISSNTWRNSGDTGNYTSHAILNNNFSNFINNTQYYLDWSVSLNGDTINVLEGLEAFHTIEREIVTPTPTPTSTPTPIPDITTISGQITQTNEKIDNLTNKITGYTNESGEYIAGAFEQQAQNFWGNSGDLSGEKQENDINNALGTIKDTISGEISQTEIAGALNNAENKFKNILEYGKSNPQALDLKLEWPDIKYENMTIIESGEINFSAMCREIEELGTVKNYINIIATFGASIAIIKHVWNLLLATLGIDNPYLYEDEHGDVYTTETLDEMTGEITTTITQTNGRGSSINHKYKKYPEVKHNPIGFRR